MRLNYRLAFLISMSILPLSTWGQSEKKPEKSKESTAPSPEQVDPTIEVNGAFDKKSETIFIYLKKGPNTKFNFLGPWSLGLPQELLIEGYAKGVTINKKPNTTTDDPQAMPLFKVDLERYELKVKNMAEIKSKKLEFNLKYFFCRSDGGLCKINKKTVAVQM